jgi:uncharacterized protein with FMN-binding domain
MQNNNGLKLVLSSLILALFIIVIFGYALYQKGQSTMYVAQSPTPTPETTPVTPPVVADTSTKRVVTTSKYKNGNYSAVGGYDSPGGYDQLGVSLTLQNDIVTSVTATAMAQDRTSLRYEQRFISGFQSYVTGNNIDSISLSVVSGSSLTPIGFNDALSKIKAQAI